MIYLRCILCFAAVAASFPKAFQYLWLAHILLTPMAPKHFEKVLAHFEVVHIETGFKKGIASKLHVRHDPSIGYIYKQESLNFFFIFSFFKNRFVFIFSDRRRRG